MDAAWILLGSGLDHAWIWVRFMFGSCLELAWILIVFWLGLEWILIGD